MPNLTPEIDKYIRAHYDPSVKGRCQDIAVAVGWPKWAIERHAKRLKLTRVKDKPWSAQDEAYVERHYHCMSVRELAKRLHRSTVAIRIKAKRLEIRKSGEGYTACSLAEAFGVDSKWVTLRIASGKFKAFRRHTERTEAQGGDMWFISEQAVIDFIKAYPLDVDLRKVDQLWFLTMIADYLNHLIPHGKEQSVLL